MNTITKIKIAKNSLEFISEKPKEFISEHQDLFEFVDDLRLCENCDYFYFNQDSKRLIYHQSEFGELFFNFQEQIEYHRRKNYSLAKEPLAKSLAIKRDQPILVWDTTCGTGKDALLISSFGAKVVGFERNPIVFLLLLDANRVFPSGIQFIYGDSSVLTVDENSRPHSIFYDPMYPEKKKSALPRKEMQVFKEIIGPDTDSEKFLEWARKVAIERVVVKRSLHAPKVHNDVTASYEGKSTRYDMYKIFK